MQRTVDHIVAVLTEELDTPDDRSKALRLVARSLGLTMLDRDVTLAEAVAMLPHAPSELPPLPVPQGRPRMRVDLGDEASR